VRFHQQFLVAFLTLLVTVAVVPRMSVAGKLDAVRSEVRNDDDDDDHDRKSRHRHRCDDDWDDDDDDAWLTLSPQVFVFPWAIPIAALDDRYGPADFPPAPYSGTPGHLAVYSSADDLRTWGGSVSAAYGTDFKDLDWSSVRLRLDTSSRLGLDTEWHQWVEQVPGGHDSLATGDFNLAFRFAQSDHMEFHTGIGINWLADSDQGDVGFNFTYGFDWFPVKPWTVSTTFDMGSLNDAGFFHGRVGLGVVWGRCEFFSGYDYHRIGAVTLDGLLVGLRLWF